MRCPDCHRAMVSTGRRSIEDEKATMTITRWRCRPCDKTAEEIRLSAGHRGDGSTRIRYAVAPLLRASAAPVQAGGERGMLSYA